MKLTSIIEAIHPIRIVGDNRDRDIVHLLTDSRAFKQEESTDTLFFALRTSKRDGAAFIRELYAKGLRCFVVEEESIANSANGILFSELKEACFLIVKDSLLVLQDLAAYKRTLYKGIVIGITGSNGKTVVKEWLYQLLKDDFHIVRSPKSYNSQIGVPLSVWLLETDKAHGESAKKDLAIFEAGISEPGEMERLERIIRPTIGVITYIGEEHSSNFDSLEHKRAEKMKLFAHCPVVLEDPTHQNVRTCALVMRALGYDEDVIRERILKQTHETVLRINLHALTNNVRYFKSLIKPTTKLTCMVKAFAYGTGSVEISKALQDSGMVDYLAVAVADEGVELRRNGIHLPMIIMDPEVAAMDLILENTLEPNVYSFSSLETVVRNAEEKGLEYYPIHIKIDSGMHRLGFYEEELPQLVTLLKRTDAVRVTSVFSHLACSDDARQDAFTLEQIRYFDRCAEYLKREMGYPILKHICNSAGIERFAAYQYDMCRLGIGLYGISFAGAHLQNVCTLETTILSVKTVKAGETIGYGRHTTLATDRQIAVVPIGYADGFDRRFSNYGGEVIVRGKRCPVVGNVCMDQAMIDVTGTDAKVGDIVQVFGDKLPLQELSDKLGTIPYEVLTSISRRVQRIYSYED